MTEPPVRVIVVDDDPQVQADLEDMLEPLGYDVRAAGGRGEALIEESKRVAKHFRPHIAIVDLCLWDDGGANQGGLQFIEAFPSAHCILYSGFLSFEVLRQVPRDRVTWISKAESPQELVDAIDAASRKVCARCGELRIYAPEGWSPRKIVKTLFPPHDLPPDSSVEDLLRQLLPSSHTITIEFLQNGYTEFGPVGRGRSIVTKLRRDDRVNPLVLKLGPAKRIKKEVENYAQYIDGNVGGLFNAGIHDRPQYFWDLGGVLYTFLGTPSNDLHSFAHFYRHNQDPDVILWPLRHLLNQVWGHFYRNPLPGVEPLYDAYESVLRLQRHLDGSAAQGLRWPLYLPGVPSDLPNPVHWVRQNRNVANELQTRMAVTHGDLHGDNLFVDPDHAWVIDFERSGPGPILRDVTELEVDILTRLVAPGSADPASYYDLAMAAVSPMRPEAPLRPPADTDVDPEMLKALDTVQRLRTLAHRVIRIYDQREYLWGLLLDALFVALLSTTPSVQRQRALLLSAVLCSRLEHWET